MKSKHRLRRLLCALSILTGLLVMRPAAAAGDDDSSGTDLLRLVTTYCDVSSGVAVSEQAVKDSADRPRLRAVAEIRYGASLKKLKLLRSLIELEFRTAKQRLAQAKAAVSTAAGSVTHSDLLEAEARVAILTQLLDSDGAEASQAKP